MILEKVRGRKKKIQISNDTQCTTSANVQTRNLPFYYPSSVSFQAQFWTFLNSSPPTKRKKQTNNKVCMREARWLLLPRHSHKLINFSSERQALKTDVHRECRKSFLFFNMHTCNVSASLRQICSKGFEFEFSNWQVEYRSNQRLDKNAEELI